MSYSNDTKSSKMHGCQLCMCWCYSGIRFSVVRLPISLYYNMVDRLQVEHYTVTDTHTLLDIQRNSLPLTCFATQDIFAIWQRKIKCNSNFNPSSGTANFANQLMFRVAYIACRSLYEKFHFSI